MLPCAPSFVCSKNKSKSGPKTEPCSTPFSTFMQDAMQTFKIITFLNFNKLELVWQIWLEPQIWLTSHAIAFSLSNNVSWFTTLYAFDRSKRNLMAWNLLSHSSCILSIKVWLAVSLHLFLLKSFWASINILFSTKKVLTYLWSICLVFWNILMKWIWVCNI
jgi:hypothetical protein